jgi:RNA polymerase sigma-70 factor (ECF subfamily)
MCALDILALNDALDRLASIDERQGLIVELRFFGGMAIDEIAELLKISPRTVKREWTVARAWLLSELRPRI